MNDDPNPNARKTDPHTSQDGADSSEAKWRDRMRVWTLFRKEGRPLAQFQVDALLGGHADGKWRKRRSDLTRDGWLVSTGATVTCPETGKQQILWAVNEEGLKAAGEELDL